MTVLYIKNMVCHRCELVVRQELEKLGLHPEKITLGEVQLAETALSASQYQALDQSLQAVGFERIDDRRSRLMESIKSKIIDMIHHREQVDRRFNWSHVLSEELHYDYNYISTLFSSVEGITLEQYIIKQKIEKAKELLFYDELSLSEIADRLGYSSVAHLSAQFKKITGQTPSSLKKARNPEQSRKPLDTV